MKYCPNCHSPCPDDGRFCPVCGTPLNPFSSSPAGGISNPFYASQSLALRRKRRRIWIGILVTVLIGSAAAATGFLVWRKIQNDRIQELENRYAQSIETGERYLLDQDYERAEASFLEARSIEPKKPEPYISLYEIYAVQKDEEKKEELVNQAKENLSSADYETFSEKTEKIEKESAPDDKYTVLSEIGPLDQTPIRIDDHVWIIEQNHQFSFINDQGEIISDSPQEYLQIIPPQTEMSSVYACLAESEDDYSPSAHNQWPTGSTGTSMCSGRGGSGPVLDLELRDDGKPVISDASMDQYLALKKENPSGPIRDPIKEIPSVPIVLKKTSDSDKDRYWIWNPWTNDVTGPYDSDEGCTFSMNMVSSPVVSLIDSIRVRMDDENGLQHSVPVYSPYPAFDNNQLTLWSADGRKSLGPVDSAKDVRVIDMNAISFRKNGRLYVFDQDLNPLLIGDFEAASSPSGNKILVKTDGNWKLVEITDRSATEAEKKELSDSVESHEQTDIDLSYVVMRHPMYTLLL